MKKSIFTLAFAFIALFAANTVSAQSLSQYTADFNSITNKLTLNITKIGGFGSKAAFIQVDLFLEVEGTIECTKYTRGTGNMFHTFKREGLAEDQIRVEKGTKNGSLTTNKEMVLAAEEGDAVCPGGWKFAGAGDPELVNAGVTGAWVVLTQLDKDGAPISVPQVQTLVGPGLPQ